MSTYVFDFDGTLVDSMPIYISNMLKILNDSGVSYPDDIIKKITPLGVVDTAKYFINMGVKKPLNEVIRAVEDYAFYEYSYNIPAKVNVISTITELKKRGHKINVLTASPHITLDPCLKRLEIFDVFDNVWSCDDFKTTKADPEIYKMVAEKTDIPLSEILFADDNINALKTAKKAGLKTCGVFDASSEDMIDEIRELADFYVVDFKELLDITF